jgi:hypothetical protein
MLKFYHLSVGIMWCLLGGAVSGLIDLINRDPLGQKGIGMAFAKEITDRADPHFDIYFNDK